MAASLSIEFEGTAETQKALDAVCDDLARKPSQTDREVATRLASKLAQAAASCGVPVAPRAASSVQVKSGASQVVAIGATQGRSGKPSYALTWGSERGGRNFAVPRGGGYWIKPTVDQFKTEADGLYNRAISTMLGKHGF